MDNTVKITKWGNSQGIRIPMAVLKETEIEMNDLVYVEADGKGRILLNKKPGPKKGTLEYLFEDYNGESFKTELIDVGEPAGNEKW